MKTIEMVMSLFGGLGLFLFGMNMMGDGLQNAAGDKLKGFFQKLTSNPLKGVMTGAIITAIIQSSSATTVMVVGFVNAQLMNLYQATAVIMGANVGTTVTSQLVALNIDVFVPVFIGIGSLVVLFAKKSNVKQIGSIVLGFGILFLGMSMMKDSMEPLKDSPVFMEVLKKLDGNMFLGILTGLAMTAILQSSSATTGILIALSGTGVITINMIIPVLFGCNIGTCVTALLSSIGTSKTARKAAIIHLLFNVIGTLLFIPLFGALSYAVTELPILGSTDVKRQIANAHTIFNIGNTIVLLPFIGLLVKAANKIIKGNDEEEKYGVTFIDERLLESPAIAIAQTVKEITRMANKSKDNLGLAMEAFRTGDSELIEKVYKNEKLINILEDEITRYLIEISKLDLADKDHVKIDSLFHVINDAERIGDHAENIVDLASEKKVKKLKMSEEAEQELDKMFKSTIESLDISISMLETTTYEKLEEVVKIEENIDLLERKCRQSHINRLNKGTCDATIGTMFLDIASNLERIGDHSMNIAQASIQNF